MYLLNTIVFVFGYALSPYKMATIKNVTISNLNILILLYFFLYIFLVQTFTTPNKKNAVRSKLFTIYNSQMSPEIYKGAYFVVLVNRYLQLHEGIFMTVLPCFCNLVLSILKT